MRPSHLSCTTATFGGKLPEKLRAMQSAGFAATEFWPRDLFENAGPLGACACVLHHIFSSAHISVESIV